MTPKSYSQGVEDGYKNAVKDFHRIIDNQLRCTTTLLKLAKENRFYEGMHEANKAISGKVDFCFMRKHARRKKN